MDWIRRVRPGWLVIATIGAAVAALSLWYAREPAPVAPPAVAADAVVPEPELIKENLSIRRGDNLGGLLTHAGLQQPAKAEIIAAIRKAFDVKQFRAGRQLTLTRTVSGDLEAMEYVIDPDHKLQLLRSGETFAAAVVDIPGVIRLVPVFGVLQGSLFESMERAGERSELAIEMAEIFAWSLDFYRDPREGDQFSMLVEKKEYTNGQPPTYRRILAAKYDNAGTTYDAYLFPGQDGKPYYYSHDGRSLQSAFLRSPLKFSARVSSHFSNRRLHPVLKIYRPHHGTDYAAPTGTPVYTVAAGRVISSGRSGGGGNMVKVRHTNGFETQYLHLSKRLVRSGQRVEQGQRIGLVGATGLATGPHLDFRVLKAGRFLNFERLRLPPATTISASQSEAFAAGCDRYRALMESRSPSGAIIAASTGSPATSRSAP